MEIAKVEQVESTPIQVFAEQAYRNYAMYVIMDRALPFIGDGLKPVQRRIVYAMSELGLKATAKFKKSARTVGDVLGKYHPHGDTACYEAMVLMAQSFSYRYPLVEGQGNWGSIDDPKSFAAMRYTEAKLSSYADNLLTELDMGTVAWGPNFDGTLQEPLTLPARLPNVLLNGASGIAVGMATDIPPHNLKEIVTACIVLLENPNATLDHICEYVQGPDYPTGAEIITPREEILEMYRTGRGSLRVRAIWEVENGDIVITALPYQVSPAKIMEQVAVQIQQKKLPLVADIRDEGDQEDPVRLVITPRSNRVDREELMLHLFATTELERTHKANFNVIGLDRKPRVKSLLAMLTEWLRYRIAVVRRRLEHRLKQIVERLHILDGLMIAFLNLDRVIKIIRTSDDPKPELIKAFKLTDVQAEAILQLRLRQLARLEEQKLRAEQHSLAAEKADLEKTLSSDARLRSLIKKELSEDAKKFGNARRTAIVKRSGARMIAKTELVPVEPVTVILSRMGWVRTAKGHDINAAELPYKGSDSFLAAVQGRSNQSAVFLDSTGRSYAIDAGTFPSARSNGTPLSGFFSITPQSHFIAVLMGEPTQRILVASDAGYGFITQLENLITRNQKGKAFLSLMPGSLPLQPLYLPAETAGLQLAAVSEQGRMLVFALSELPELPRGKGNKIIQIGSRELKERTDFVRFITLIPKGAGLTVVAGKRHFKMTPGNLSEFMGERGRRGKRLPRGFQRVDGIEVNSPEPVA